MDVFVIITYAITLLWASQVVLVVKNPPANAGDIRGTGLIPGSGRSYGEGTGNPLQYSCLENPMDRGTCWATVQRIVESQRDGHHWNDLAHTYTTLKLLQYFLSKNVISVNILHGINYIFIYIFYLFLFMYFIYIVIIYTELIR